MTWKTRYEEMEREIKTLKQTSDRNITEFKSNLQVVDEKLQHENVQGISNQITQLEQRYRAVEDKLRNNPVVSQQAAVDKELEVGCCTL